MSEPRRPAWRAAGIVLTKGRQHTGSRNLPLAIRALVSQLLTLYTTPVVYLYVDRLRARWARRKNRREAGTGLPQPIPDHH